MTNLTEKQIAALDDAIGEASACNDNDCSCKDIASIAQEVLDGFEPYEYFEDEYGG
jgi:hypothetical protein